MDIEELESCIAGCSICHVSYDLAKNSQRPHVLACGHTFCGRCLEVDKRKCHNCRKISLQDAAINYQLEEQLKAIHDFRDSLNRQPLKYLNKMLICLDCKIPVLKTEVETMDLLHCGHEVISCEGTEESQLKFVFWLLDIFNRGSNARTKFEKMLQSILYVGSQYQKGVKVFIDAVKEPKFEDSIVDSLRNLLKKGPIPPNQPETYLIQNLKRMRKIESKLGFSIHNLAHSCSTMQKDNLFQATPKNYQELYAELAIDHKKGLHVMPNKKQLTLLPELQMRVISAKILTTLRRTNANIPLIDQSLLDSDF